MTKKRINLLKTGLSIVDENWGGFYRGGTYLLIGPRKSGRTLMGLQYAMEGAKNKEVCLYFTNMRPKDLMIHAASIDLDLQTLMNQNLIIVVRVSPPAEVYNAPNPDDFLVEYLNDIVTVVNQYHPDRLIFDELTPFVGFENLGLLQQYYLSIIESIEEKNVTSFFVLAEPATSFAQMIVDTCAQYSTAIVYLQKEADADTIAHGGKCTITPNVGHTEGQFTQGFTIEPYKGVVFRDGSSDSAGMSSYDQYPGGGKGYDQPAVTQAPSANGNSKYRPLSNVDMVTDKMTFSNLYDLSEFTLILNNQIALYKSTGQAFTLISMKLDVNAERQKILTMSQLQNAVRLSLDKKEKICVVDDKILILIGRSDDKALNVLVSKIKSNLPNNDPQYLNLVMQYLFAFTYEINDRVENAESILKELLE